VEGRETRIMFIFTTSFKEFEKMFKKIKRKNVNEWTKCKRLEDIKSCPYRENLYIDYPNECRSIPCLYAVEIHNELIIGQNNIMITHLADIEDNTRKR
jgi:hypothetical protein